MILGIEWWKELWKELIGFSQAGSYLRKFRGDSRKSGSKPKNAPQTAGCFRWLVREARVIDSGGYINKTIVAASTRSIMPRIKAVFRVFLPLLKPVPAS